MLTFGMGRMGTSFAISGRGAFTPPSHDEFFIIQEDEEPIVFEDGITNIIVENSG